VIRRILSCLENSPVLTNRGFVTASQDDRNVSANVMCGPLGRFNWPLFCELARFQLLLPTVSTITAILEPHEDGSLHLPLPVEMRGGKVKVIATLIPVTQGDTVQEAEQRVKTLDSLRRIAARGGIKNIPDPTQWQREIRKDRPLPGREE
jgi:hypothetical protein